MLTVAIALLIIGAIAVAAEAHVPRLGVIGGPGVVALGAGAALAVAGLGGGLVLGLLATLVLVVVAGTVLAVSLSKGVAVRRRRVRAGPERLLGHVGVVRNWDEPLGTVDVDGAIWRARRAWSEESEEALHAGESVVVEHLNGLTLTVRRAEEWEVSA